MSDDRQSMTAAQAALEGNLRAVRTGARMAICRGGKLPQGMESIQRHRDRHMRRIEGAVVQVHGVIGPRERLLIEAIGDAVARRCILQRRHRELTRDGAFPIDTEMRLLDSIDKANRTAVQLIGQLKLERSQADLLKSLYQQASQEPAGDAIEHRGN